MYELTYHKSHDLNWLLYMIDYMKKACQEDLAKEEDLSLYSFDLKGSIRAYESVEKMIRKGMIKE